MKNNQNNNTDEIVDIEMYTKNNQKPPVGKKYKVKIDDEHFTFQHHLVTGTEILEASGNIPTECHTIFQKLKNCDFEKIDLAEQVDLTKPGIEKFVVKPPLVFNYTVDDEPETTDQNSLTANQILIAAGLIPEDYYLVLVNAEGTQISFKDKPDETILMKCPGLKFISIFRGETPVSFQS